MRTWVAITGLVVALQSVSLAILAGSVPAGVGTRAAAAAQQLVFDNGKRPVVVDGADGRPAIPVSSKGSVTSTGAWSADGKRVAYIASGAVYLKQPGTKTPAVRVKIGDRTAVHVAFAPLQKRTILAFAWRRQASDRDAICWLDVTAGPTRRPRCRALAGWRIDGIVWRPNGKEMLLPAEEAVSPEEQAGRFGLLRLKSSSAFSTDAATWSAGRKLATSYEQGHGVRAAAYSPNGKKLALASNLVSDDFRISVGSPGDLSPEAPDYLPVQGCDVAWRPDGKELAVVQSGAGCATPRIGPIVRVRPTDPRTLHTIVSRGQHPSWQPPGPTSEPRR